MRKLKEVRYRNIVITRLENGKFEWNETGAKTLKKCKAEIDAVGGAPWGEFFNLR